MLRHHADVKFHANVAPRPTYGEEAYISMIAANEVRVANASTTQRSSVGHKRGRIVDLI